MHLTKVNSVYGAPMGRRTINGDTAGAVFEVELMPLTDGDYDSGGAYWGGGQDIYCIVGVVDEEEVHVEYMRGDDRGSVVEEVRSQHPVGITVLPENGSLVKQMIAYLYGYMDRDSDVDTIEAVQEELEDLEEWLTARGLA